jgi:putative membrane protein
MRFLLRFVVTALTIYALISYGYLSGIIFASGNTSLLIFTGVLSLVNLLIGGVLRLITLPIRWLTMGVVGFAISLFVVWITVNYWQSVTGTTMGYLQIAIIALFMGIVTSIVG